MPPPVLSVVEEWLPSSSKTGATTEGLQNRGNHRGIAPTQSVHLPKWDGPVKLPDVTLLSKILCQIPSAKNPLPKIRLRLAQKHWFRLPLMADLNHHVDITARIKVPLDRNLQGITDRH